MDSKDSISDSAAYALKASNGHNPPAVAYALADDYDPKASPDKAFTVLSGSPTGGGRQQMVVHPQITGTLCASGAGLSRPAGMASEIDLVVVHESAHGFDPYNNSLTLERSPTLGTNCGVSTGRSLAVQKSHAITWIVRRFLPVECERLQGFPDGWTDVDFRGKPASDGPRYKAIGNSMAVPCMRFIGDRLLRFHKEQNVNKFDREAA